MLVNAASVLSTARGAAPMREAPQWPITAAPRTLLASLDRVGDWNCSRECSILRTRGQGATRSTGKGTST